MKFRISSVLCSTVLLLLVGPFRGGAQGVTRQSNWLSPSDGSWTDGANWSTSPDFPNNGSPDANDTYEVVIDESSAPYTVALHDAVAVDSVTLNAVSATLALGNSRLETPLIDIEAGTLLLGVETPGFGGTEAQIVGATIAGNGTLRISGALSAIPVVDSVSLGVDLVVPSSGRSPPQPRLIVRNGLEVQAGASVVIEGRDALADIDGTQTFAGEGQIIFDDPSTFTRSGTLRLSENTTLTIGSDFAVRARTMGGSIGGVGNTGQSSNNLRLVNNGLLSGEAPDQPLQILNAFPSSNGTFQNYGVVQAIEDGVTIVGGEWNNAGTFRVGHNGELWLAGVFSHSDIGDIERNGGRIVITGRVENTGSTLTASSATGDLEFGSTGQFHSAEPARIVGGVISSSDGASWVFNGGTLENVTLAANSKVQTRARTDVLGDLTLQDAVVTLASTDSISDSSGLSFDEEGIPQSIHGSGIIRFGDGRNNYIFIRDELTVGSDVIIESTSRLGVVRGARLVNDGTLSALADSQLTIEVAEFQNRGKLEIAGGARIGRNDSTIWRNEGVVTIKNGGKLELFGTFSLDDLGTLVDEGGEVQHSGIIDLAGETFDLESLHLANPLRMFGGELRNGRLTSSGDATIEFASLQFAAFFENITLATDLFVTGGAGGAGVHIRNGLTLEDSTITMPEGASLRFEGENQMLDGVGVLFAPNRPQTSAITDIAGDQLIIGENITIRNGVDSFRELRIFFAENRGTIISEAPNTLVTIGNNVSPSAGTQWTNNGAIVVNAGTVEFWGNYSVDELGDLQNPSGKVVLNGNVANHGKTIHLPSGSGRWTIDAEVSGGVIESGEGITVQLGGLFDSVTLKGQAESHRGSRGSGSFVFRNLLTLDDAILSIDSGDALNSADGEPLLLDGAGSVQLNGSPNNTVLGFTRELTIGAGVTVQTSETGGGSIEADAVVNLGSIAARTMGKALVVNGELMNQGSLSASSGILRTSGPVVNDGGTLVLEGGTLQSNSLSFVNGGQFEFASGRLTVEVFDGNLSVPADGIVAPGPLGPDAGTGTTVVMGEYSQQPGSVLEIEIGGPGIGDDSDFVNVAAAASLDGDLTVELTNGYRPIIGNTYTIFDSQSLEGEFENVANGSRLDTLDGRGSFIVHYGAASVFEFTQIVLSDFLLTLPGDYNDDGNVDAADYTVWRDNVGAAEGTLPNDADGGMVGTAHYETWRANYGKTTNDQELPNSGSTIPEPATLALAMGILVSIIGTRRWPPGEINL